jgi:hypothetical protein
MEALCTESCDCVLADIFEEQELEVVVFDGVEDLCFCLGRM